MPGSRSSTRDAPLRLPDFLIIGAMKSGTTTLFRDLAAQPGVFLPDDKEPDALASDAVLQPHGRQAYARLFENAPPTWKCGEASTAYSKLPDVGGVPERAASVLGPEAKLIYLLREPVARAVSHFHHLTSIGAETRSVDAALSQESAYVDYGRYAMQMQAWIEVFPRRNLRCEFFEEYIAGRQRVVAGLHAFIGAPGEVSAVDITAQYKQSEGRPQLKGTWRRVAQSKGYRKTLQRWIPWRVRRKIRRALLPRTARLEWPADATVDALIRRLAADGAALEELVGPLPQAWTPARVRAHFRQRRETS